MERRNRTGMGSNPWRAAAVALALVVVTSAAGCRATKPEVPPGRGFSPETGQTPPIGFSSQPNMNALNDLPGTLGSTAPAPGGQLGMPMPGAGSPYGAPTTGGYGPPGTSGVTSPSMGAASGAGLPPGMAAPVASPAAAPAPASVPTQNPF